MDHTLKIHSSISKIISDKQENSGGQPIVDFDASDNCRWYVTTKKAMNFQDDLPSIPIYKFNDHYVLVFVLSSIEDATESCHY